MWYHLYVMRRLGTYISRGGRKPIRPLGLVEEKVRSQAYLEAGADGILIHSKSETPDEVLSFAKRFRSEVSSDKPLVVMPTTYPQTTEGELAAAGINIVIYANHLLRAAYPAMRKCAERILECDRAYQLGYEICQSLNKVVELI